MRDDPGLRTETIRLLEDRVSVRSYADRDVDDATIDAVLAAAMRAPTSSNIQAYSVMVVRNPETKAALSAACGNQAHIRTCPVWLGFCADLTRMEAATGGLGATNLEMGLVASIDASLVGMAASLAAESVGLRGVMIGAVRNDAARVAEILGLPTRVYCVYGMCLGWPGETVPPQKPRFQPGVTVHRERYGDTAGGIAAYDAALAAHYRGQGRETDDASWSGEIAKKFTTQPRAGLRAALLARGFDFE